MKVCREVCIPPPPSSSSFFIDYSAEGFELIYGDTVKSGDDPQVRGDAYKTLFVARLSYDTTEKDLEREFGRFGPIERVCRSSHVDLAPYANTST